MENRIIDEAELARWAKIRELKALIKFSLTINDVVTSTKFHKEMLPNLGTVHSWVQWPRYGARRHLLLAYGFLRGKSYKAIENRTGENNSPKVNLILALAKAYSNKSIEESDIINLLEARSIE